MDRKELNVIDWSFVNGFTQAEFERVKVQYGKAYLVTLDDEGDLHHFAAVRADRATMACIADYARKGESDKVNDVMLKNMVKLGDTAPLERDATLYLALIGKLAELMEPSKAFFTRG